MLITTQMLWDELQETKKMVAQLVNKEAQFSIEEISLNKVCKLLKLGTESVLRLVNSGQLKARKYRAKDRTIRYRFRLADVREFQKNKQFNPVNYETHPEIERSEDVCKRIFNN